MNGRPSFSESHQTVFLDTTGVGRPSATLLFPATFNASPTTLRPLIVFASSRNIGALTQLTSWFGSGQAFTNAANALVLPVSTRTGTFGSNSWDGNKCCCWSTTSDGAAASPSDSDYLATIAQAVIAAGWPVDPKAVFGLGDSAGEGVLFRSACDHSGTWAGIAGMSGAGGVTTGAGGTDAACSPANHVHLLHAHGDADVSAEPYTGTQAPNGGMQNACNSTVDVGDTMDQYLAFNSCGGALTLTTSNWAQLDGVLQTDLYDGASCPSDGSVEHWRLKTTAHNIAAPTAAWQAQLIAWFAAHHKP